MDVFGSALATGGDLLRDAAIDAVYELGLADRLCNPSTVDDLAFDLPNPRRLRPLLDYLVAIGAAERIGDEYSLLRLFERPAVPRSGWGLMADVIRTDRPLPVEGGAIASRYHEHLVRAGAPPARELAAQLAGGSLLDLGSGAGTYTAAYLEAHPGARATVVDHADVIALARAHLARFGDRVRYVASDIRTADVAQHDVALLANVLHLHGPRECARIVAAAARAGRAVVIKDLRLDDDRRGPFEGIAFALNMAIYTDGGDVYTTSQLRAWLAEAGLVDITEQRLASQPDGIVVIGRRPR